jgi:hypothetical protein
MNIAFLADQKLHAVTLSAPTDRLVVVMNDVTSVHGVSDPDTDPGASTLAPVTVAHTSTPNPNETPAVDSCGKP